jgi:hypothetical protein
MKLVITVMIKTIMTITVNNRKRKQNNRKRGRGRKCVKEEDGKKINMEYFDKVQKNE